MRRTVTATERFFDRLKLSYKWRFDRFTDLRIVPYRGFGTAERVWVKGRVLDDPAPRTGRHDSIWHNIRTTVRRLETDEVPGASLLVRFAGCESHVETDQDGYFEVFLDPPEVDRSKLWHELHVQLLRPSLPSGEAVEARGTILIPPNRAEFAVISDMDDTVVRTGAYNRLQMGRVVLLNSASTRTPFPGVASFYRALVGGPDGGACNPFFYVSSSPWNLYDLFVDFLEAHDIPAGPILLRDFGFTEERLGSGSHGSHKLERIERILSTYPALPFVLIGDSGQRDPEIYAEIVRQNPNRIRAIFIRDVSPPERDAEVRAIAKEVDQRGVPMVLVQDTQEAVGHARDLGLVTDSAVANVEAAPHTDTALSLPFRFLERLFG